MTQRTAADTLIDTLKAWGVDVVFGLPGDGINGIMEALRRAQKEIRFVQVRHEETAAFMACGYAKVTGKLGVCLATSGPGGIHLLNGLYDAKLDGQPVLAITGLQFHDLLHTLQQQDVELDKLFMDVAVYNTRVMGPAHVRNVTELACRAALAERGVAHITLPKDIQELEYGDYGPSARNVPGHTSHAFALAKGVPGEEDLARAAALLNAGRRTVIMAGRGAIGAADELEQVAERLGAVIVKPLLGKAAVPDDSPYTTGPVGLVGSLPSQEALEECDTLFIVGSSFPYIEFYPKPGQARAVQIDIDPVHIGLRYPVEVPLVGDARQTLQRLLPALKMREARAFLKKSQLAMKEWRALMEERGTRTDRPMKPQVIAHELGRHLREDAIFTADSGTAATWYARHIPVRRGQMCTLSGNLATMANGFPYAIAAQIAYPDRQCVAFVGDGAFTMLMGDFVTCVKYKLPVKVVILKNNALGQIKWEQIGFEGNPEYGCELEPIDFAAFARSCGGAGYTIEDPAACSSVLERALAEPGPTIIEAVVDPHEPPLPPKVTLEQAKKFAKALAKGTPEREKIALTVLSDKVRELI
ncbi:MAG TPA: thiamine pyrophosphate-dependent enzyme [Steroidobacteraceae bacterium]|jgi:pyruvate dehydrogenase (quinone)/pyruvate oxidase